MIEWPQFLENGLPAACTSMTIGVFDGVHRGHQALIERVVSHNEGNMPVVITFRQNHKGEKYAGNIQTFRQKTAMFERLGLKITIVVNFTESFRHMTGIEFLELLLKHGKIGFFAVGANFRCGYGLDTDAAAIQRFFTSRDIPVEIVPEVMEDSQPISSSRIRSAIVSGNLLRAQAMLGHPYTLDLMGLPESVLPPPGEYQVILHEKLPDRRSRGTKAAILIEKETVRILRTFDAEPFTDSHWEFAEFTTDSTIGSGHITENKLK